MNIGKRIAARRKELGMTQEALANKLSISPQAVSRWETGWTLPDMDNLAPLAAALKMGISSLIGEDQSGYEWELRDQLFSPTHMFTRLKTIAEVQNLTETYKALYYIRDKHAGQYRKHLKFSDTRVPYIVHPLMMACHAQSMGLTDDSLLAVTLLHDVCEDCGVAPDELPFPENIRRSVALLTKAKHKGVPKQEAEEAYYKGIEEDPVAAMVKVIDRCNNVSTMAQTFDTEKLAEYIEETEVYVIPLLKSIKRRCPVYNNAVFLTKYQMLSVLESLKVMLLEK